MCSLLNDYPMQIYLSQDAAGAYYRPLFSKLVNRYEIFPFFLSDAAAAKLSQGNVQVLLFQDLHRACAPLSLLAPWDLASQVMEFAVFLCLTEQDSEPMPLRKNYTSVR